jgi:hypothetical protein
MLMLAVLLSLGAAPALAQSCGPAKQIGSLKLQKADGGIWLVPVLLNGAPKQLVLNTGNPVTRISSEAATELKMPAGKKDMIVGNRKFAPADQVHVTSLAFPNLGQFSDSDYLVAKDLAASIAGELGMDILGHFDIELDLANGAVNLFDATHCRGQIAAWKNASTVELPFAFDFSGLVRIKTKLDGMELPALLDTSYRGNLLYISAVRRRIGKNLNDPDYEKIPSAEGTFYRHAFKALELDSAKIPDPVVLIWDSKSEGPEVKAAPEPLASAQGPLSYGHWITFYSEHVFEQLTLGIDTLSKFHVYIAMKEKKVYLSPAN